VLLQIETEMKEARLAIDCLHYYFLFVCESQDDVATLGTTLRHLPTPSLKMVVFLLMNDAFINLLPDNHPLAPLQINDHRDLVFDSEVSAQQCVDMIFAMLAARNYVLPAEMLSVSIDAKLYSLYNAIDDRKLTLADLLMLGSDGVGLEHENTLCEDEEDNTSDSCERKNLLIATVDRLQALRHQYIADRKSNEKFHDMARVGYFLLALNSPADPSLGMNSTERLIGALRLSIQHDAVIDIRACDVSNVDMHALNFENAKVLIAKEQVNFNNEI
jgi:hypothetical protein